MMKRILTFAVIAAIACVSCDRRLDIQEIPETEDASTVFTASTEAPATKTALEQDGEQYNVNWQSGDRITIVDDAAHVGVYTTTSTTTQGAFTYVPESGAEAVTAPYKAWYPAGIYGAGTPALPATQDYVAGNISGLPMYAEGGTTNLAFKNLGGIIRLNISTTQGGKKVRRIELSANEGMSGAITNVASLSSETPVAATVSGTAGVTLDCGESGVAIGTEPTAFHIAVPANKYTGLKITVVTTDGEVQTRTAKSGIDITRSCITTITLGFNGLDKEGMYYANSGNINDIVAEFNASLYDNPSLILTENISVPFTVTRAEGIIDLNGHTVSNDIFLQNNVLDKTLTLRNGTVSGIDGMGGQSDYYCGTVVLENVNTSHIWNDGHKYVIYGGTHEDIQAKKSPATPGTIIIHSGYFSDIYRYIDRYGGSEDGSSYTLLGGKYKRKDATNKLDDWCASGFSAQSNTGDDSATYPYIISIAPTDLSATATANTYIVSAAGKYKFRATVKGNGSADLGGISRNTDAGSIASADLVWATFNTAVAPSAGELIKDIHYADGYVYFSTGDVYKEGNALVAIKDGSGNILWSWHIWLHNYAETYLTGANSVQMMDRDLGALSTNVNSPLSYGLYYQWGRKDPFVGPSSGTTIAAVSGSAKSIEVGAVSVATAVLHPANYYVAVNSADRWTDGDHWCSADSKMSLWSDSGKTIFDPCPPGWRLPSLSEITGMGGNSYFSGGNGFPPSGYFGTEGAFYSPVNGTLWSTTVDGQCAKIQVLYAAQNVFSRSPDMGFNLRCVRESQ